MTDRELLERLLPVMERACSYYDLYEECDLVRERLEQPEQEPVGTLTISHYKGNLENYDFDYVGTLPDGTYSLYTTPPQRKPLTDEVIWLEYQRFWPFHPAEEPTLAKDIVRFARAIEAAHGIKGEA